MWKPNVLESPMERLNRIWSKRFDRNVNRQRFLRKMVKFFEHNVPLGEWYSFTTRGPLKYGENLLLKEWCQVKGTSNNPKTNVVSTFITYPTKGSELDVVIQERQRRRVQKPLFFGCIGGVISTLIIHIILNWGSVSSGIEDFLVRIF